MPVKGEIISEGSISSLIDEFLHYKKQTSTEITYNWVARPLKAFRKFVGSKKKVSTITTSDVDIFMARDWSKRLDGKPLSISTKQQALTSIKSCFLWLSDEEKISKNPLRKLKVGTSQPAAVIITPEQIAAILEHFKHDQDFVDLISFEALTGCRISESRIIECCQVKLKENKIVLRPEQTKAFYKMKKPELRVLYLNEQAKEIVIRNLEKHGGITSSSLLFQSPYAGNSKNQWTPGGIQLHTYSFLCAD